MMEFDAQIAGCSFIQETIPECGLYNDMSDTSDIEDFLNNERMVN
jgi:hypothetical protein